MFDPLIVRTLSKLLIIFLFSFKNVHLSVAAIVVELDLLEASENHRGFPKYHTVSQVDSLWKYLFLWEIRMCFCF